MSLSMLNAISPIDGRYRNKVEEIAQYFSEFGLIKYRVLIEIEYFIAPTHSELLSAVRLNQHNERIPYQELNEVKLLEDLTYGMPNFKGRPVHFNPN